MMSWTHLGMYDINLIEFIALAAFVVAGLLALRSTTAPAQERVAFAGFVLIEMVIASGQFWDSVFGDGRTYVDAYVLAVVLLLATPAGTVSAAASQGTQRKPASLVTAAANGTRKLTVLATSQVVTNKRLAVLAAIAVAALIVVARRRILFQ
jgi:hypothetical protein